MGILSRFSTIMRANMNALLDKVEDPEKIIDQTLLDLRKDLAQVRKETASVMATEKDAARRVEECEKEIKRYTLAATNAVKAGEDDDARKLLEKKQLAESNLVELKNTLSIASDNAAKMRQMHEKLTQDIEVMEAKKASIKGKVAVAKAQDRVNKAAAGTARTESAKAAFDRMEAKANRMLDTSSSEEELISGANEASDLADKWAGGASNVSVEDELAQMKASFGLSGENEN